MRLRLAALRVGGRASLPRTGGTGPARDPDMSIHYPAALKSIAHDTIRGHRETWLRELWADLRCGFLAEEVGLRPELRAGVRLRPWGPEAAMPEGPFRILLWRYLVVAGFAEADRRVAPAVSGPAPDHLLLLGAKG